MQTSLQCGEISDKRSAEKLAVMLVTNPRLGKDALLGQLPADVLRQILAYLEGRILCTLKHNSVVMNSFYLNLVRKDELHMMQYTPFVLMDVAKEMNKEIEITFSGAVQNLKALSIISSFFKTSHAVRTENPDKDGTRMLDVITCHKYVHEGEYPSVVHLTHATGSSNMPIFCIKFTTDVSAALGDPDFPKSV